MVRFQLPDPAITTDKNTFLEFIRSLPDVNQMREVADDNKILYFIGDVHGGVDVGPDVINHILEYTDFLNDPTVCLVFIGDYIDKVAKKRVLLNK